MRGDTICVAAVAAVLVLAGGAQGSPIMHIAGDPNAMLSGSQRFEATADESKLSAVVEYAVYGPGMFDDSFGTYGFTYPSGTESQYFYAYEIFNDLGDHPWPVEAERDYVRILSVGIDGDEQAGSAGYVSVGIQAPNLAWVSAVTFSAYWRFTTPTLNYGGTSDVLYFTSPYGPEWETATLSGGYADTRDLPSPAPEPATLMLLAAGSVATWLRRRRSC